MVRLAHGAVWDNDMICWDVSFDEALVDAKQLLISSIFCDPFNDLGAALGGGLPQSQIDLGWTIFVDPCNYTLESQFPDHCGSNADFVSTATIPCVSSYYNAMQTAGSTCKNNAPRAEYAYSVVNSAFSRIKVTTLAPSMKPILKPTADVFSDEGVACAPLWFSGTGVWLEKLEVDLTNCVNAPYLAVYDRICVRFTGTDVSDAYVHDVVCHGGGVGVLFQPDPLTGFRLADNIDVSNVTVFTNHMDVDFVHVAFFETGSPDIPVKLAADRLLVHSPELFATDLVFIDDVPPTKVMNGSNLGLVSMIGQDSVSDTSPIHTAGTVFIAIFVLILFLAALFICHSCIAGHLNDPRSSIVHLDDKEEDDSNDGEATKKSTKKKL